jgi:quinol monooxygenase YgiN
MAYTVSVTWIAKPGEEEAVAAALRQLIEPSRAEPGVIHYIPHRDPDDPRRFYLFEMYADADAYAAHGASEHFRRFGLEDAVPRLEERRREYFEPMT